MGSSKYPPAQPLLGAIPPGDGNRYMGFGNSYRRPILVGVSFCFVLLMFLALAFGYWAVTPKDKTGQPRVFLVRHGTSFRQVAYQLEEDGFISSSYLFMLWGKLLGYSKKIKSGEYRISSAMPPVNILAVLAKGIVITHTVTIPEGYTMKQIAAVLSRKGIVSAQEFLKVCHDPKVIARYGLEGKTLEGYLYPDSYQFSRGLSAEKVVDVMVRRFLQMVSPYRDRIKEKGMSLHEVVTLASIVEKETGLANERPLIASVFINRLKKGMRLESDPTVIYGIENFNGNLTKKDLERRTPYNTYVIKGLPPGPIANPGIESIRAVLYPASSSYLYFVSKNDGSHYFSASLAEHNRAVARYQKHRHYRVKKRP